MTLNSFFFGERKAVVHEAVSGSKSPQGRGTNLLGGTRKFGLRQKRNTITGVDVVQGEIALGMDSFITKSWWNSERATIDFRPRKRCRYAGYVANGATYFGEVLLSSDYITGERSLCPNVLVEIRKVLMVSSCCTRSTMSG